MRVAVIEYPGIRRACYEQLIDAALELGRDARMQAMARWDWARFSKWLLSHPFQMDSGGADKQACATACDPPQRMRRFPQTMNCWERVLHQLAWFSARGTPRATLYDHDTLVGRHIEVLVPPTTYLGAATSLPVRGVANGASEQALAGVLGGLQGGVAGAGMGASAGPYGALAGFILGAGLGAVKGALSPEASAPAAAPAQPAAGPAQPAEPAVPSPPPALPPRIAPLATVLPAPVAKIQPAVRQAGKRKKARRTKR